LLRLLIFLNENADVRHPVDRGRKNEWDGVMFGLILPYVIGLAIGIDPGAEVVDPGLALLPPVIEDGSGDEYAGLEPEPQVPTGKFTTAVEVKPILGMTKTTWVAVRAFEGQDLLYFSHLLAWRCGLWDIRYGVNGEPAETVVGMEPCHDETAQPNGLTDVINFPIYATMPLDSVESVYVEIVFDDGTTDFAQFERSEILIP
jgi:hypothetical protein